MLRKNSKHAFKITTIALAVLGSAHAAVAADCEFAIGSVMSLTGPAGQYGQAAAKSIELAFRDINAAGGVLDNCHLTLDVRDAQTQSSVAVDVAKQLVDVKKIPVIIGGIISSVSIPIVTSVTGPAKVLQVSPASSSPTLTALAQAGKTDGYFFRTITSDALQGTAAAKYALDQGLKKLSVIHVNNDFGVNMIKEFSAAYQALGGNIVSVTPYNQNQPSYQAEVTQALEGSPEALYLIAYPGDGATIARGWISQGGPQAFLLNDGMNSADFIKDVGAKYLNNAYGTSSGTTETASTEYFAKAYNEAFDFDWQSPAAVQAYDAAVIVSLAIAKANSREAAKIRDAMRGVVDPNGEVIHAGPDGYQKALALLKTGQAIRYEGVIGQVNFDQWGDITGPFKLWRIQDGEITTVGQMSAEEVAAIKSSLK